MFETSHTLLDQLRHDADGETWRRLVDVYGPLLRAWIDRYDVQAADADDLVQDVLIVVMRELPGFVHSRQPGAFRTWLRRIVVNRLRNFWRKRQRGAAATGSEMVQRLDELEDPRSDLSRLFDREHDRHLTRRLLELIEDRFTPSTREAFRRLAIDGATPEEVAAELDLSLSAVFTAKSRVLRELRRLGKGMID